MSYKVFETDRLFLRPTSLNDAEFILELMNTPHFLEYIGDRNIKTLEDAKDYIEVKTLSQLERLKYANYTLIKKSDNTKIGSCGLYDREGLEGIDIGFALLPEYEGMGFGYESANRLKEAAFNEFGLDSIRGITIKENTASRKLLEKLGLKFKEIIELPDDDAELLLYELKKEAN